MFVALHWMCSFLFGGGYSPSVDVVPTLRSLSPMKTHWYLQKCQATNPSLSILIISYPLAPAFLYCIRTMTIQLLHVPGSWTHSFKWTVFATVNSWNHLAWVATTWALLCLLIHACLLCLLCLESCRVGSDPSGWWIGMDVFMSCRVRAKCVNPIW